MRIFEQRTRVGIILGWMALPLILGHLAWAGELSTTPAQEQSGKESIAAKGDPVKRSQVESKNQREFKDQTEAQLSAALAGVLPKLGELQSWQQSIFREEVLNQPQRFVKNYQKASQGALSTQGLKVDVDLDSVRAYLKFHDESYSEVKRPALLYLRPALACSVCTRALPSFRTWIRNRLERRGFRVELLSADDFTAQMTSSSPEETLDSLAQARSASLITVVEWAPVPIEEMDTVHADEKKYRIKVRFKPTTGHLASVTKEKEILELDSFDAALARVRTDAMTELGSKTVATEGIQLSQSGQECLIEVTGIKDFQQLKKVKALLSSQLKDVGVLEDRMISREKFVFVVATSQQKDQIQKLISELPLDSGVGNWFHLKIL